MRFYKKYCQTMLRSSHVSNCCPAFLNVPIAGTASTEWTVWIPLQQFEFLHCCIVTNMSFWCTEKLIFSSWLSRSPHRATSAHLVVHKRTCSSWLPILLSYHHHLPYITIHRLLDHYKTGLYYSILLKPFGLPYSLILAFFRSLI